MIAVLVASLLAVAPQQGPEVAPPALTDTIQLTLQQAIDLARTTNPDHVRDQLNFDNDRIRWLQSRANRYLPEVDLELTTPEYVSALRTVAQSDGTDRFVRSLRRTVEADLRVSQPLPSGGSFSVTGRLTALNQPNRDAGEQFSGATFLGFRLSQDFFGINNSLRGYRVAREGWVRAQTQSLQGERQLAERTIENYYDLVQAIKEAQIDSVLFVRDSLRLAERQAATGPALSELDSLKLENETARSAYSRTRSRQSLRAERASFNEFLGLPTTVIVVPDTVVRINRIEIDVEQGLAYARENRLDLKLAELGVENRRASLKDAHRTSPIRVSIDGTMGFDGSAQSFGYRDALSNALSTQDKSTSVQLSVSIPLFDRFDEKYSVAQSANSLRMSELGLEEQRRELENEVRLVAQNVRNANTQLELAEKQFSLTRRTMEIQTDRFERGEIQSLEFLIDQTDAREAEIDLLEAQVEVLLAYEEWKAVIGVPPFPDSRPVTTGSPPPPVSPPPTIPPSFRR